MDLFNLAAKLTLDKTEYEEGLNDAEREGESFGAKLGGTFGNVAKAGAVFGGTVVAAGAAIYDMSTSSAAASDRIDKMSQKIGISRSAYQELDFICSQSGTSVDSLRAGMKTLTNQMDSAQSGTGDAADAFAALGLSVVDSNGRLKSQEQMLFETINALQGMDDQTQKAALANKLLGRSGTELMPLLNGEAGSMEAMRQQAYDLGLVLSDNVIDAGVKLTDTIDQTKRAFNSIMTVLGAKVMPLVQSALDFVLENFPTIQMVTDTIVGTIGRFADSVVKNIKQYILPTLGSLVAFVKDVFSGEWGLALEEAKNTFKNAFSGIGLFFKNVFNGVKKTLKNLIPTVSKGIKVLGDALPLNLKKYVLPAFGSITAFLDDVFKGDWAAAWEEIKNILKNTWEGITTFFGDVFNSAKDKVMSVDWVGIGTTIFDTIKNVFKGVMDWLWSIDWGEVAHSIYTAIYNVIGGIVDFLKNAYTNAAEFIKSIDWVNVGQTIWDAITGAFSNLVEWFTGAFEGTKDGVEGIDWIGLGSAILDYIVSAFKAIGTVFLTLFENAKNAIMSVDWIELGGTILDFIRSGLSAAVEVLKKIFFGSDEDDTDGVFGAIKSIDWKGLGTSILNFIKEGLSKAVEILKKIFFGEDEDDTDGVFGAIKSIDWKGLGENILGFIKDGLSAAVDVLKFIFFGKDEDDTDGVFGAIKSIDWKGLGTKILDLIKEGLSAAVSVLKFIFFGNDEDDTDGVFGAIKHINWKGLGEKMLGFIKDGFALAKKGFEIIFHGEDGEGGVLGAIKSIKWKELGGKMLGLIQDGFDTAKKGFEIIFHGEDGEGGVVGAIKSIKWKELGSNMLDTIKGGFDTAQNVFKTIFQGEDGEGGIIGAVKGLNWTGLGQAILDKIKEGLGALKDWFLDLFDFSDIHIKMPKINVDWTDYGWVSIPHFSVAWEAKGYDNPLLFDQRGLLGGYGFGDRGNYQGGEMVYSHDRLMDDIKEAVGGNRIGDVTINVYQQPGEDAEDLAERISRIMADDYDRRAAMLV